MPTSVNLRNLPDNVRAAAIAIATENRERLIGWRALTEPDPANPTSRVRVRAYQVITDVGVYEVTTGGLCMRASVLHSFGDLT